MWDVLDQLWQVAEATSPVRTLPPTALSQRNDGKKQLFQFPLRRSLKRSLQSVLATIWLTSLVRGTVANDLPCRFLFFVQKKGLPVQPHSVER